MAAGIDNAKVALAVAAHPDDEVLGCGGTLAKLRSAGWQTHVLLLGEGITARDEARTVEARRSELDELNAAVSKAHQILDTTSVTRATLPDNRLDGIELLEVVKLVERAVRKLQPTRIYTHHYGDVNVDHRVVHEAVQAAARPQPGSATKELFFFEVPSSTEWRSSANSLGFAPAAFTDISQHLEAKQLALDCYSAEMRAWPHPRSREGVAALAAWRGATVGVAAAEAFEVGRLIN